MLAEEDADADVESAVAAMAANGMAIRTMRGEARRLRLRLRWEGGLVCRSEQGTNLKREGVTLEESKSVCLFPPLCWRC